MEESIYLKYYLFDDLGLTEYYPGKITIQEARRKARDCVVENKDIPWCFLEKVLVLDYKGRSKCVHASDDDDTTEVEKMDDDIDWEMSVSTEDVERHCFLDVKVAVYLCCDNSLKELLAQKLHMSHISIPFALPDITDENKLVIQWCTYRGMRFNNDFANRNGQVVSCLSVNDGPMSTSTLLNLLLSDESHDTFYNASLEKKSVSKKKIIADGLIDATSFLPPECICQNSGKCSCIFKKLLVFLNLYGISRNFKTQQTLICKISSLVIILVDIGKLGESNVIDNIKEIVEQSNNVLIVFSKDHNISLEECKKRFDELKEATKGFGANIAFLYDRGDGSIHNNDKIRQILKSNINSIIEGCEEHASLERQLKILKINNVTSDDEEIHCTDWKQKVDDIHCKMKEYDINIIKNKVMPLQNTMWQEWSDRERQVRTGRPDDDESQDQFTARLQEDQNNLRKQQVSVYNSESTEIIKMFSSTITELQGQPRRYFIHCLSSSVLDMCSKVIDEHRKELLRLRKEKEHASKDDVDQATSRYMAESKKIEKDIENVDFCIKDFFREIGQAYEAFRSQDDENLLEKAEKLSSAVAELFIEGFPLEIVDSKAKQVPMIFVKSVLGYVQKKIKGKVFILSVLGIQSSGKSTLLNTMFGTQFATSVGLCTDGVNAQLIPIPSRINAGEYKYIMIIDTKGLRSTDTDAILESHSWDNEVATLLFGISDLTLLNMKGESKTEINNILHVVIHALLKIKAVNHGLKLESKCLFIHQNVDDSDAREKLQLDNRNFKERLDDVTSDVAERVGVCNVKSFEDIIKFDVVNDIIYFPGLWRGIPPMATINAGYSHKVRQVREVILNQIIRMPRYRFNIETFSTRLQDVWDGILGEDFVFCFRNHLEINAYIRLESTFNSIRWDLNKTKLVTLRTLKEEMMISPFEEMSNQIKEMVDKVYDASKVELDDFFEKTDEGRLLREWRFRYQKKLTDLKDEKLLAAEKALANEIKIQEVQNGIAARLEEWKEKARRRAIDCAMQKLKTETEMKTVKQKGGKLTKNKEPEKKEQIEKDFNDLWTDLEKSVPPLVVKEPDIESIMIAVLRDMGGLNLLQAKSANLTSPPEDDLVIEDNHFSTSASYNESERCNFRERINREVTVSILQKVLSYMEEIKDDIFNKSHAQQTAKIVIDSIVKWNKEDKQITLTEQYKVSMLKFTARYAMTHFSEMQKAFRTKIDYRCILEEFKAEIKTRFTDIISQIKSEKTHATLFRNELEYLIDDRVQKQLLEELPDDIMENNYFMVSKRAFHIKMLKDLLEKDTLEGYMKYVDHTEECYASSLRKYINLYLFEHKQFSKQAISMTNQIVKETLDVIIKNASSATEDTNMKTWIEMLISGLAHLFPDIERSTKHVMGSFNQKFNAGMFYSYLITGVTQLPSLLGDTYTQWKKLEDLGPNGEKTIFNQLLDRIQGCKQKCPFCHCLCSSNLQGHEDKCRTPQHYPAGIGGHANGQKICFTTCNALVGSSETFRLQTTTLKFSTFRRFINFIYPFGTVYKEDIVPFKRYKEVYNNWRIDVNKLFDGSLYWKRVVSKFAKELANHHGKMAPEVPKQWSDIKMEEAIKSLDSD